MGKIIVNLDVVMAKRKITLEKLAERVGLTQANLSILKTGKAKAVRFSTLEAICRELDCQPGGLLEYRVTRRRQKRKSGMTKRPIYATKHIKNINIMGK